MAKLIYWCAECLDDAACYSIIGKTKKEVYRKRKERSADRFGPITKHVIEYQGAFDLFEIATQEGGGRGMDW